MAEIAGVALTVLARRIARCGIRLTRMGQNGIDSGSLADFRHVAQGLERRLDTAEVGGSNPPVPTTVAIDREVERAPRFKGQGKRLNP